MKKALPLITLLSYIAALVVCIVNIIRGAEADLMTIIIFLIYVVGVMVLMSLTTRMLVKQKRGDYDKNEDDVAFEELAAVANAEESSEENEESSSNNEEKNETVSEVFAEDDEKGEDATDIDNNEEAKDDEVDVISTEGAEESTSDPDSNDNADENDGNNDNDDKNIVVVPVIAPIDNEKDEDEEDDEEDNEEDEDDEDLDLIGVAVAGDDGNDDPNAAKFARSRYTRTYASKLIQADDELKSYYSIVKNAFMSYKKVTCSVSREHERIRRGRTTVGIIKVRGKSLLVYLALDPAQFDNTMYVGEDVSSISKYSATPFLYRVKGPRKANRAARLIAMMAEKLEMTPTAVPANEDYIARFPYESTEALVAKGLIIDNVAEAERKAEEARLAAEEAEKTAQKAIEEAIKAKEHASKVSERSERTVDEIEAAEEAKAAKQESNNN